MGRRPNQQIEPARRSAFSLVSHSGAGLAATHGKFRRSAIFVGHVNLESKSQPQRGGILWAAVGYGAPTEPLPAAGRAGYYKDATPTELGAAERRAASTTALIVSGKLN